MQGASLHVEQVFAHIWPPEVLEEYSVPYLPSEIFRVWCGGVCPVGVLKDPAFGWKPGVEKLFGSHTEGIVHEKQAADNKSASS